MIPKISKKDKSLLLLIASGLALLWFSFSMFSHIFFSSAFATSDAAKIITQYKNEKARWLNVGDPLKTSDLKNRIILLDFWTYACVNCIHIIPEIKKLEKEFGNKLTVIGVHSGKFDNEKDFDSIKKAVLKYDITHPVINDSDLKIWDSFKINAWPSLVLIDPYGDVKKRYIGEGDVQFIRKDIKRMINKYRYQLNRDELPQLLEKNKIAKRVLSYPTKIAYSKKFSYKSYEGPVLFIANSGRNNILVSSLKGDVILEIGSQKPGFRDGDLARAKFNNPTGLLYKNRKLYIADTQNHAIREIDFNANKVTTLLGNGMRGKPILDKTLAQDTILSSPTSLEFYPDDKNIAIANSGTHQILQYSIKDKTTFPLAGNGSEGIADGKFPQNSLAQTSDIKEYEGKLYFTDSETSSLRVLNKNGEVTTLIGNGLFDFGHKNGDKKHAKMQHPLGLAVGKKGVYISDSFNHTIRKYDFKAKKLLDLIGSAKRGDKLGATTNFDEPEGIIIINDDTFIIADTNNNRIIKIDFSDLKSSLIDIMPPLRLPKEGLLQYLPNLYKSKRGEINTKDSAIEIALQDDWKLNESGPSFFNLLELVGEKEAHLIQTFDWNMIRNQELTLPELENNKEYILQGTIYYCEKTKNAPCYISSFEQILQAKKKSKNKAIKIELIYN